MIETHTRIPSDISIEGQIIADEAFALTQSIEPEEQKLIVAKTIVGLAAELSTEDRAVFSNRLGRREEFVQMARAYLSPFEAYLSHEEDERWGKGVIEIGREDLPRAIKRLGEGRNPAIIVRASEWEEGGSFVDDFTQELALVGDFSYSKVEKYPQSKWKSGSSIPHLDKFPQLPAPQLKWSLSASQLEKGKATGIVGLATNKQRNLNAVQSDTDEEADSEYASAKDLILGSAQLQWLFERVSDGRTPKNWESTIEGVHLTAVTLNPKDVMIWPQGGPHSKLPAWHCLRQVGSEPRESISYHFIQRS
ncbi:MAG: hypothetical protein WDN66_02335 [Candidatus Saccharibacteria bacterium]